MSVEQPEQTYKLVCDIKDCESYVVISVGQVSVVPRGWLRVTSDQWPGGGTPAALDICYVHKVDGPTAEILAGV